MALLLLGWGLSAMQWTALTSPGDLRSAVLEGTRDSTYTLPYTLPLNATGNFTIALQFGHYGGYTCYTGSNAACYMNLPGPVSNSTTTTQDYVLFTTTLNNGGLTLVGYYTAPNGTLAIGWDKGCTAGGYCTYWPVTGFTFFSPYMGAPNTMSQFFQAPAAGNYTIHMQSTQCLRCSATNATGYVSLAVSTIAYTRTYFYPGLATAIVGGVSAVAALAFLSRRISQGKIRQEKTGYRQVDVTLPPSMTD
jgi:hypothetical protein